MYNVISTFLLAWTIHKRDGITARPKTDAEPTKGLQSGPQGKENERIVERVL